MIENAVGPPSKGQLWTGWIVSLIPGLFLLSGSFTALSRSPVVVQGMAPFGFSPEILPWLGITELLCSVLYLLPWTAPVGAILMSAYMGGAVVAHARVGDPKWVVPVAFGVLVWVGREGFYERNGERDEGEEHEIEIE